MSETFTKVLVDEYALPVLAEEKRMTDAERITEEYAQAVRKLERELAEVKAERDGLALCLRDEADIATSAQLQSRLDSALAALQAAEDFENTDWIRLPVRALSESRRVRDELRKSALSGHAVPVAPPPSGDCSMCARARERMAGRAAAPWTCPQCGRASMPESAPPRPPLFAVPAEHPALGVLERLVRITEHKQFKVEPGVEFRMWAVSWSFVKELTEIQTEARSILSAHGKEMT